MFAHKVEVIVGMCAIGSKPEAPTSKEQLLRLSPFGDVHFARQFRHGTGYTFLKRRRKQNRSSPSSLPHHQDMCQARRDEVMALRAKKQENQISSEVTTLSCLYGAWCVDERR